MFCRRCGKELSNDSVFCSQCGCHVEENVQPQEETFVLTLDRSSQLYLLNPPIKAIIDGTKRVSIPSGETATLNLRLGAHKIVFTSCGRTAELDFNMTSDMVISIKFSRLTGGIIAKII